MIDSLIMLQQMMPRIQGTEATMNIRRLNFEGFVVGVTGNTLPEDVADFVAHGADIVHPKPFDIAMFNRQLVEFRKTKRSFGVHSSRMPDRME